MEKMLMAEYTLVYVYTTIWYLQINIVADLMVVVEVRSRLLINKMHFLNTWGKGDRQYYRENKTTPVFVTRFLTVHQLSLIIFVTYRTV